MTQWPVQKLTHKTTQKQVQHQSLKSLTVPIQIEEMFKQRML